MLYRNQSYGNPAGNGTQRLAVSFGRGYPGLGQFWIAPSVLEGAAARSSDKLRITKTLRSLLDGTVVEVVQFRHAESSGETVYEYDPRNGLLIHTSVRTPASMGGFAVTQATFRGMRTVSFPWQGDRAPNWVRPEARLQYTGTDTFASGTGIGDVSYVVQDDITITEATARWSLFSLSRTHSAEAPLTVRSATGTAQVLTAIWLPRSAASAALSTAPTLIDEDPITRERIYASASVDGGIRVEAHLQTSTLTAVFHPTLMVLDRLTEQQNLGSGAVRTLELRRSTPDAPLEALAQQPSLPDDPSPQTTQDEVVESEGPDASTGGTGAGSQPQATDGNEHVGGAADEARDAQAEAARSEPADEGGEDGEQNASTGEVNGETPEDPKSNATSGDDDRTESGRKRGGEDLSEDTEELAETPDSAASAATGGCSAAGSGSPGAGLSWVLASAWLLTLNRRRRTSRD